MASNIPVIVQGNSFSLAIPLQIYYINGDQMDLQDYTPDPTDEVSVQLKGSRRNYTYTPTIDGNIANIGLTGNELADNYSVVVSVVKADGQRLRSFRTDQFFIVESSDDLTQADIIEGLEENVIYLNTSIFVAGADGRGIVSIVKTSTSGLVDTYTITYTDNTTSTFDVTNGAQGEQGVGITSIAKTSTSGKVDTYTITLSNGSTTTFEVTNGMDGVDLGLANIVNDLTTGGATNVLSAEMGKELKGMVDKISPITLTGNGSNLVTIDDIPVCSGHTYKIWIGNKDISMEGVTGYSRLNIALHRYGQAETLERFAEVLLAGVLEDYYIAEIPEEYNDYALRISQRSKAGTVQRYYIEDITDLDAIDNKKLNKDVIYGNAGNYTEGAYLSASSNLPYVTGSINDGITPLIPVENGDKVMTKCGYVSGDGGRYFWLYDENGQPLTGLYYNAYRAAPVTINNANVAFMRSSFSLLADDAHVIINGEKAWEFKKKVIGLAEWNYKSVGITKTIYGIGEYACWANAYVNNTNGVQNNSSVNSCTGFIGVEDFETIEIAMSIVTNPQNNAAVCFYDSNGTFISAVLPNVGTEQGCETRTLNVPYGAKYVRCSIYTDYIQHWKLIGRRSASISGGGTYAPTPQKVTLEFGALGNDGQMKPYSSDFLDNARTSLYYKLQSVNLPYAYTIYVFNSAYTLVDTISAQANEEYTLDTSKWHKIVINYTANSLPKKEIVIDLNVLDTSYNIIPAKTIKTFQYSMNYKKGRGLYVDGDTGYSEAGSFEDTLISNTLRMYLPTNYSPKGEPVKLIYKAHGTGGYASIDLTTWGGDGSINYLADEGFALYDMFAGTSYYQALTTNRIANYNIPIQLAAQKAAYEWVVRNFNVDPQIYVVGKSHGGLAGIYATNNIVPTRAVALLAPLITQVADMYQPWGLTFVTETKMCLDDMCFIPPEGVSFDLMCEYVFQRSTTWKNILLSNLDKQVGLNPYINGVTNVSQEALLTALMNNDYQALGGMDNLIRHSDIPVKVWCAVDDEQVLYANGYNWIKSLQNGGSNAQFRAYPSSHGRHSFDSFTSTDATIIKDNVVTALGVSYTAPRVYVEVVNFLNQF